VLFSSATLGRNDEPTNVFRLEPGEEFLGRQLDSSRRGPSQAARRSDGPQPTRQPAARVADPSPDLACQFGDLRRAPAATRRSAASCCPHGPPRTHCRQGPAITRWSEPANRASLRQRCLVREVTLSRTRHSTCATEVCRRLFSNGTMGRPDTAFCAPLL